MTEKGLAVQSLSLHVYHVCLSVAILFSAGRRQLTNTQHVSQVSQPFFYSALRNCNTTHAAIISTFVDSNGGGEKNRVTPQ